MSSSSTDFGDLLDEAGNLLHDLQLSDVSELGQTRGQALDLNDLYQSVRPSVDGNVSEALAAASSTPGASPPAFKASADKLDVDEDDAVIVTDANAGSESSSDEEVIPKAALPDINLDSEFDGMLHIVPHQL